LVQLVTVRWGNCPAAARLVLLRCSAVRVVSSCKQLKQQ